MSEKPVYIITFNSANYSMYVYKLLKDKKLSVYMIQTPCLLSSGCARSIEVPENQLAKVIDILKFIKNTSIQKYDAMFMKNLNFNQ